MTDDLSLLWPLELPENCFDLLDSAVDFIFITDKERPRERKNYRSC